MDKRTNTARWVEARRHWRVDVQRDGLRRSFFSSTPGRAGQREANEKADAWIAAGAAAVHDTRCGELLDQYAERLRIAVSYNYWRDEECAIRLRVKPLIGHIKIGQLTQDHLQHVLDVAAAGKSARGTPLSKKTLQNLRATLTAFVKYCRKRGLTTLFPEDLTISRRAPVREKRILQPVDLAKLFSSDLTVWRGKEITDPLVHAYRFAVLTGLRPGELLGLEWRDIRDGMVRVRRSINDRGETTSGKNNNAQRTFALYPLAQQELRLQAAAGPRVFPVSDQKTFRRHWYAYCDHNGIPRVTPYELRHTFVSMVQDLGELETRQLVGHSQSMDTYGVYGHTFGDARRRTADHLQEIVSEILASEVSNASAG